MDNIKNFELQSFLNSYLKKSSNILDFSDDITPFMKALKFSNGEINPQVFNVSNKICEQINDFLFNTKEIFELGLRFNLHLAGGALRDLLLGNHLNIKDLDLIFEVKPFSQHNSAVLDKLSINVIKKILSSEANISQTEWDALTQTQKIYFIIFSTLSSNYNIKNTVTLDELKKKGALINQNYTHMLNKELEAVITIEKDGDYPCDILLTNSYINDYVKTFSFEICKITASFLDADKPKLTINVHDFFEKIKFHDDFLSDAKNKKITLHMSNHGTTENIQRTMEKHFPRIAKKYPNHTLNLIDDNVDKFVNWKKSYLIQTELNNTLTKHISIDTEKNKPIKV